MRKLLFLGVLFFSLFFNNLKAKESDSFLIKRLYLDTIQVLPTIEEIDWYLVYNKNGYNLAVDYVLNHKKYNTSIPKEEAKIILTSEEYKNQPRIKITKEQLFNNLLYVTGSSLDTPFSQESLDKCYAKLINMALKCCDNDMDIIDYMTNTLMCRSANLAESNTLIKIVRESKKSEIETWKEVLSEIMKLEDVVMK